MEAVEKKKRVRRENPHHGFSLARPSYKNKGCRRRKSSIHHCRFKDTDGIWRRLPLFADYQSSASFARKIVKLVSLKSAGESPDPDLCKWADQIDPAKRGKLFSWGILDRRRVGAVKSLADHLDDWKESILAEGSTEGNARQRRFRAKSILLDDCGYIRLAEIDKLRVTKSLASLNLKTRTRNHYTAALKQFGRWLVDNNRASHSPLEGLANIRVTDEQIRRSLTTQTFTELLRTTMDGPMKRGMTGWERATLYWLASETGYRANELRSLTASSFSLDDESATVALQAGSSKNKRRNRLSITPELAGRMRELLRSKSPTAPAFLVPHDTANMLRFDLERAGIPFRNDQDETFDFHALRVQCASSLARANVHVKVMQERLRHSTSKLTLDIYSRLSQSEQDQAAVNALPRLALGA